MESLLTGSPLPEPQMLLGLAIDYARRWGVLRVPDYTEVVALNWGFQNGRPVGQPGLIEMTPQSQEIGNVRWQNCSFGGTDTEACARLVLWLQEQIERADEP